MILFFDSSATLHMGHIESSAGFPNIVTVDFRMLVTLWRCVAKLESSCWIFFLAAAKCQTPVKMQTSSGDPSVTPARSETNLNTTQKAIYTSRS